ncbi:flagellar hook-associated protein 1 FlgK [Desulfonatronum zhilinae]|nr:flagellar hook-associated protein 1 FlgK [Desulfonatronum zhilinae]
MTVGVNSLLNTGKGALLAFQSAIHVTGENIANVNTPGYSRRSVRLEENPSIDFRPGQIGTGVTAKEVIRHYDYFIERQYLDKSSTMSRWDSLHTNLRQVEMLFNESIGDGLNNVMAKFWADWQNVSLRPDDMASRSQLLSTAQNLTKLVNQVDSDMSMFQQQINDFIIQDVDRANELMTQIAEINSKIAVHNLPGSNNANALLDKRDSMLRDLAGIIDIQTIDKGGGNFLVLTTAGHTLVDGDVGGPPYFQLKVDEAKSYASLTSGSLFDGSIKFSGNAEREYLVKVVSSGALGTAKFELSLDGGETWLTKDDGTRETFTAQPDTAKINIQGVDIWFDPGTENLAVGDTFTIVPKSGLYWYKNTSSAMNITPQIHFNGVDNDRRATGGSLTGYFNFRDDSIGQFREKLDSLATTLAWEVNRIHSQGAGLEKFTNVLGTYSVNNINQPLGNPSSGLFFGDENRLKAGNLTMWVYDANGDPTSTSLTFPAGGSVDPNFDPNFHTLEHARQAFDGIAGITATISNNKLRLEAAPNTSFAFGSDSTGLLAALGLNTFFDGTDASTLSMTNTVHVNLSMINAGHVNGAGEINTGDNVTAVSLAALQYEKVNFYKSLEGDTKQTLSNYYNSLTANVGAATSNARFNFNYHKALTDDLRNRQEEIAGVNLDEEMSNLIKFQHSYSAASKLISTADQMFQTILSMK